MFASFHPIRHSPSGGSERSLLPSSKEGRERENGVEPTHQAWNQVFGVWRLEGTRPHARRWCDRERVQLE
jgi:hypothetical protein